MFKIGEYSSNKWLRGFGEWCLRRFTYANSYAELHWWEFWIMIHNTTYFASLAVKGEDK